ncbi:hypothetical protein AM493_08015 [Flavobacterium akiainvivens]|uniref:DUF1361 domain-containing protein n=1 Tax=Flavobacterium akiainvivens TaxID=1202724 RepID=A0A0M8MKU9_9FLAO|nr:hypothetical protein AM493_08015 [Flavobacterium akiainvivens]
MNIANEIKQYRLPATLCLFCVVLLAIRIKLSHSLFLAFLIWNLFLAGLPLAISLFIQNNAAVHGKRVFLYPLLLCWLLFLPNSFYLLTDFVHLYKDNSIPIWFDILLIGSFTMTGMFFGLESMHSIHNLSLTRNSRLKSKAFIIVICLLCGFGIYIGRYLRYNSWDVLHKPISLFTHTLSTLFSAETCKAAWGITLGFGALQYLLFSIYRDIKK